MINQDIATIFYETADILEMQGIQWKPNAFRKAAREIESLEKDIAEIYKINGIKSLLELPGIGINIGEKIEEYIKTGKIKSFEQLKKSIPKGVEQLLHIPSLGPKKVWYLIKEAKIHNINDLKKAIAQKKIQKLPGFGEKSESEILKGISLLEQGSDKKAIYKVLPLALEIKHRLEKVRGVKKVEIAGSLRRMKEIVRDIDILATSDYPEKIMDAFTTMNGVTRVLAKGTTKSTVMFADIQADVRVLKPELFGAALQYFTGSKEHNVELRKIAIKKGLKLSEYGLMTNKGKIIASADEETIYNKLGLQYIPPQLRELSGELQAAAKNKIPKLIELKDIKGDLHMHTTASDGTHSIAEMAESAKNRNYEYIAITDHSKSSRIANGLDEARLIKHIKEIRNAEKLTGIRILAGSEVDILSDGSLDYSNKILKELDFVSISVHSGFKSSKEVMTRRLCNALENPYVNVFNHPTGQVIGERAPYELDFEKVFETAKNNNVAIEVNSARLDLKDTQIRQAIKLGCKISIGTDSHHKDNLSRMIYGVGIAQRGWAESKHIINTMPLKRFEQWLR